ncbi:DsrE family protein [Janthinobacterium fluminis]|uniref:DsrE family protein n=1 Tax=Janthinobacterium fluminis TaxID=2987524 RepID=A0ABT5K4A9_9BURK|nr:DsrE family protein [Janthinobacterium fluminis]MDC8758936.1 DsrE family protein [Janthinobacterium fluminis]
MTLEHLHGASAPAEAGLAAAPAGGAAKPSFFFGMMGAPFQSDTVTSLFRMVESALSQGHNVTVWNCGYATGLSQTTLVRPRDFFAPPDSAASNPNTAEMVQALFRRYPDEGRFEWLVCRYCMEERGTVHQIEQAKVKIPFSFQHYLSAADVSLVLGVK